MAKLIAAGAMHLRHRAETQRILGAKTFAFGQQTAARQQLTQPLAAGLDTGTGFQRQDLGIKRHKLAAQRFKAHRPGHIGPVH